MRKPSRFIALLALLLVAALALTACAAGQPAAPSSSAPAQEAAPAAEATQAPEAEAAPAAAADKQIIYALYQEPEILNPYIATQTAAGSSRGNCGSPGRARLVRPSAPA